MSIKKSTNFTRKEINNVMREFGCTEIQAKICLLKSIDTTEKFKALSNNDYKDSIDPFLFTNMKAIVDRINLAIERDEIIVIYGDYDCDGITSIAMLYLLFKEKNANCHYYIPNRANEGYGLNIEALEYIAETYMPDLLITVDCGVSSFDEVQYCHETLGFDVIITDHHELPSKLPECLILNPKIDKKTLFSDFAGAGVVLKLIQALTSLKNSYKYIDIAAIGTIGDLVPLVGENRIIATLGLKEINKRLRKSINALIDISFKDKDRINSTDLAFYIVPKINAMGRLTDANEVVKFLVSDIDFNINDLVLKLKDANLERQRLSRTQTKSAMQKAQETGAYLNNIIVLVSTNWNVGIVGLIAGSLVRTYKKPVIIFTKEGDVYRGSGRSIKGINIFELISKVKHLTLSFGGHEMACGASVSPDKIDEFKQELETVASKLTFDFKTCSIEKYDILLDDEMNIALMDQINIFEPFGTGNEKPVFAYEAELARFERIGQTNHIKEKISYDLELIYFNQYSKIKAINNNINRQYIVDPSISQFRGFSNVSLRIDKMFIGLDENIDKVDNDFEISKQLLLCKKETIGDRYKVMDIGFDDIPKILKNTYQSNLFLAYNIDSYNKFITYINDKNIDSCIVEKVLNILPDTTPFNRIVLFPDDNIDVSLYENIIFIDEYNFPYSLSNFELSRNVKLYVLKENKKDNKSLIINSYPDRDDFVNIYNSIRDELIKEPIFSIRDLQSKVLKNTNLNPIKIYLGIYVLFELCILKFQNRNGILIDKSVTSSLDKSLMLCNINKYINRGVKTIDKVSK